jgi:hypothetical protein
MSGACSGIRGLQFFYYCPGVGVPHGPGYAEILDQIALAEAAGLGSAGSPSTTAATTRYPASLMIASARKHLAYAVCSYVNALPDPPPSDSLLRPPCWTIGGTLRFWCRQGVRPGEFAKLGITYDYDQAAAMTRKRLTFCASLDQDAVSHTGGSGLPAAEPAAASISDRTRRCQVANRPTSAARVGARGWPVAMHFTDGEVVARCIEGITALAGRTEPVGEGPYRPRVLLCRETYVAGTPEQRGGTGPGYRASGICRP